MRETKRSLIGVVVLLLVVVLIVMFTGDTILEEQSVANQDVVRGKRMPLDTADQVDTADVAIAADLPQGVPSTNQGMPPESIEACDGLEEGASCVFSTPREEELVGTCTLVDEVLVCNQ